MLPTFLTDSIRQKRIFANKNFDELLSAENLTLQELLPCGPYLSQKTVPPPFLPLEIFDDTEFDQRTPSDWVNQGVFNGVQAGVPVKSLLPDAEGKLRWSDALVLSFDSVMNLYKVQTTNQSSQLPRVLVMFKGEDPAIFVARIADAVRRRILVESELMYNLYIDSMPRDADVCPDADSLQRMAKFCLGKDPATVNSFVQHLVQVVHVFIHSLL